MVSVENFHAWVAVRGTEILGYAALEGDVLEHPTATPVLNRARLTDVHS